MVLKTGRAVLALVCPTLTRVIIRSPECGHGAGQYSIAPTKQALATRGVVTPERDIRELKVSGLKGRTLDYGATVDVLR